ncbi:Alpha/Beta hydrolase protein [Cercophora scortea]|uniref:Alpha/Beta hydrolase protein n=1 Tax=Cercophora scortea TaxID=314031 RepID=A0AAE0J4B7_9PEZI|nr:Alpha/Beta hydrolase protein [Cercophora scortea]
MLTSHLASAAFLLGASLSTALPATTSAGQCSPVSFKLSATAQNTVFASPPNPNNETQILNFITQGLSTGVPTAGTQTVSGNFTINAIYCKPSPGTVSRDAVQILVHGILYNKTVWSGLGFGDQYNWHAFANDRGYHTLAIDRLGHGTNPQIPDPLNVVQGWLHVEIIHKLIQAVRTNAANNALDRGFGKVIYVGHSYGSQIAPWLARNYPSDADALILTGYSNSPNVATIASLQYRPAVRVKPQQFPGYPLGYVTQSNATQHTLNFYTGTYDPAIPLADLRFPDTVTDGEASALGGQLAFNATGYTGPVFIATGVNDVFFCKTPVAACEAILAATGRDVFPTAGGFGYFAPEQTGHDLSLHYSAPLSLCKVHEFLEGFF